MSKSRFPGGLITSAPVAPTNTSANGVFDGREQFQYSATSSGIAQWPGEDYEISRSLRFRRSASAYLSKTFGTATNNKIWTWSGWVKRSGFDGSGAVPIMAYGVNGQSYQDITFNSADKLRMYHVISNVDQFYIATNATFRDTSAWYHIVATYDSTQALASNRLALYVNGAYQVCTGTQYPSLNLVGYFNTGVSHAIGYNSAGPYYADCYMAEVNFIDGQALDPSYFGYTDQSTNIWMPKAYSGTYGNNGFYLPFNNNSAATYGGSFATSFFSANNTANLQLGSGDFTVEFWANHSSLTGYQTAYSLGYGGAGELLIQTGNGNGNWIIYASGSAVITESGSTVSTGMWYHIAVVRSSGTLKLYRNGVQVGTVANATNFNSANGIYFSNGTSGTNWFVGTASNLRVVKALAVYTGAFTPPTSPLTATQSSGTNIAAITTETQLLTLQSSTLIDNSSNGYALTVQTGTIPISIQLPFVTGYSVTNDASGNGNNWTPTNISLINGTTYDSMVDVPVNAFTTATDIGGVVRGNYATLDPLSLTTNGGTKATLSNGNLTCSFAAADYCYVWSTMHGGNTSLFSCPSDSSIQCEAYINAIGSFTYGVTVGCSGTSVRTDSGQSTNTVNFTTGDYIQIVYTPSASGTVTFYKNGVSIWTKTLLGPFVTPWFALQGSGSSASMNYGQQPFRYLISTGLKQISACTTNLQAQGTTSVGLAGLQANKHFEATVYTGIDKRQSINNAGGFQPDFIWAKSLTNAYAHNFIDSVRGRQGILQSNSTAAELTSPALNDLVSFDSNGFTVGPSNQVSSISNGGRTVAYQWKGGGAAVSNTSGTITSSVSANVNAGFSVVSFNSTSATGTTATVGHGLGAVPSMIIMKNRGQLYNWEIYHISSTSTSGRLIFTTSAKLTDANPWNQTTQAVTSSIFGYNQTWNGGANDNIVAYCWAAVPGYSSFGSYTGNGSADGPFAYCGFRPRWLMLKRNSTASVTYGWQLYDTSRSPYNTSSFSGLWADTAAADTASTYSIDLLSNGFKLKDANINMNASGDTYVYAAFAETPFALNNRAR